MFPSWFSARVAERLVVWCGLLGFVLFLYGATEAIQTSRMADIREARQQATAALAAHVERNPSDQAVGEAIASQIKALDTRQIGVLGSHRQNEILIGLLALFIVAQILILEYRWLVRPIVRMAAALQSGEPSRRELADYAPRRDEIGTFAQALIDHFQLVQRQRELASREQAGLSDRLARQERFQQASLSFQSRIADIVRRLEDHAGRMSTASGNLVSISSEADARAGASAQSTERVSGHVDAVACSIRDIAATLTDVVGDAERTSAVAAAARTLVAAAKDDVRALTDARAADHHDERVLADFADQLADRAFRLIDGAPSEEECRVLFAEASSPRYGQNASGVALAERV
jgi:methyl-accepting chemotaxis protein